MLPIVKKEKKERRKEDKWKTLSRSQKHRLYLGECIAELRVQISFTLFHEVNRMYMNIFHY
jgi:hypothetical protein